MQLQTTTVLKGQSSGNYKFLSTIKPFHLHSLTRFQISIVSPSVLSTCSLPSLEAGPKGTVQRAQEYSKESFKFEVIWLIMTSTVRESSVKCKTSWNRQKKEACRWEDSRQLEVDMQPGNINNGHNSWRITDNQRTTYNRRTTASCRRTTESWRENRQLLNIRQLAEDINQMEVTRKH